MDGVNLSVEKTDDGLRVQSSRTGVGFGVVFLGFMLYGCVKLSKGAFEKGEWISAAFCAVFGIALAAVGTWVSMPRRITAVFNRRLHTIFYEHRVCWFITLQRRQFDFDFISSVGWREYRNEDYTYMPTLELKDGTHLYLAAGNARPGFYDKKLEAIRDEFGFAAKNISQPRRMGLLS